MGRICDTAMRSPGGTAISGRATDASGRAPSPSQISGTDRLATWNVTPSSRHMPSRSSPHSPSPSMTATGTHTATTPRLVHSRSPFTTGTILCY
ncbi:hypothetical protein GCM10018780_75700 [Streptomyces lanatus]|nr:hypothetical protein GCM10018780_75700 [Streptomyces lanatus]